MGASPNNFVWYDLATSDSNAAGNFYSSVVGWRAADSGMAKPYTLLTAGNSMVAGIMALTDEMRAAGAPPHWTGHIGVEDVDAANERLKAAGGSVIREPEDIPGVGRFSVVTDPQGAAFILFQGMGTSIEARQGPGHIGWCELQTGNVNEAMDFYAGQFGWTREEALDMGPSGAYQMFSTGGAPIGGMMAKVPEAPRPFWLYYFYVDSVDAAIERAKAAGGEVKMGPHEVPGGAWIALFKDPQGATFAVVGPRN